jgi:hypothetical protein
MLPQGNFKGGRVLQTPDGMTNKESVIVVVEEKVSAHCHSPVVPGSLEQTNLTTFVIAPRHQHLWRASSAIGESILVQRHQKVTYHQGVDRARVNELRVQVPTACKNSATGAF